MKQADDRTLQEAKTLPDHRLFAAIRLNRQVAGRATSMEVYAHTVGKIHVYEAELRARGHDYTAVLD